MRHRLYRGFTSALFVAVLAAVPLVAVAQSAAPAPAPKPASKPATYKRFIVGDYVFSPKAYNEFSPGNSGNGGSYSVRGAIEFAAFRLPWMLAGDYRSYVYPHISGITPAQFAAGFDRNPCPHAGFPAPLTPAAGNQGCVTVAGIYGQVPVPSFLARDTDFDARLALRLEKSRIYVGVGHLHRDENYGYPKQNGFGVGAEKLPDLDRPVSVYASIWYYPSITGNFTYPPGAPAALVRTNGKFQQRFLKYQLGGTLNRGRSRLFLDAGVVGDMIRSTNIAPSDASHAAAYAGLGMKI